MDLNIIYEDKHILCLVKQQGVPSQSDKTEDKDLMSQSLEYLKTNTENPYLGLIHRLDRPVGGVIVFAKNEFANKELSKQVQLRVTNKEYLTVVCGKPEKQIGVLEDYIKKLKTINMSKISTSEDKNAKHAKLEYEILGIKETDEYGTLTLLKVKLYTGRHHQIRLQLSNAGIPIWGDNKYNKAFVKRKEWTQIALWSHRLSLQHPRSKANLEFHSVPGEAEPWTSFQSILSQELIK